MPDRTEEYLQRIKGLARAFEQSPEEREAAFNQGRESARKCIANGTPIQLMDEMPGISMTPDAEAMGWNSMVFSGENKRLKAKSK